jgi:hypothetical protein
MQRAVELVDERPQVIRDASLADTCESYTTPARVPVDQGRVSHQERDGEPETQEAKKKTKKKTKRYLR